MVSFRAKVFMVWFYSMTLGLDYSPQNMCHHCCRHAHHLSGSMCLASALAHTSNFSWQRNLHVLEGLVHYPFGQHRPGWSRSSTDCCTQDFLNSLQQIVCPYLCLSTEYFHSAPLPVSHYKDREGREPASTEKCEDSRKGSPSRQP